MESLLIFGPVVSSNIINITQPNDIIYYVCKYVHMHACAKKRKSWRWRMNYVAIFWSGITWLSWLNDYIYLLCKLRLQVWFCIFCWWVILHFGMRTNIDCTLRSKQVLMTIQALSGIRSQLRPRILSTSCSLLTPTRELLQQRLSSTPGFV